jgi:hypothetical protein
MLKMEQAWAHSWSSTCDAISFLVYSSGNYIYVELLLYLSPRHLVRSDKHMMLTVIRDLSEGGSTCEPRHPHVW